MKYKVAVFAYDFLHRKTHDLLTSLFISGIKSVLVLCAPKVNLGYEIKKVSTFSQHNYLFTPKELCARFSYDYVQCPHSNVEEIKKHILNAKSNIGLVSGARILKEDVINCFKYGLINYHPGPLPETSGLNSLYWMIEKNAKPVATAHFIDKRVDAGLLIQEHE